MHDRAERPPGPPARQTELIAVARSASRPRPPARTAARLLRGLCAVSLSGLLAGCNLVVMQPSGDVALQQRKARLFRSVLGDDDTLARSLTADDIRGLLDG